MSARKSGVSLPELMMALVLLGLLSGLSYWGLEMGSKVLANISGTQDISHEFARAHARMQRDLSLASFSKSRVAECPASLGGPAKDGQAICLLTPCDESTGSPEKDVDGTSFFKRHIIYYLSVPVAHTDCTALADAEGYEEVCPHKVLIREVLDWGNATSLGVAEEQLMSAADLATVFWRPQLGALQTSYSSPKVRSFEVVARQMISMRVSKVADPDVYGELQIQLFAANLSQKTNHVKIGIDRLRSGNLAKELRFSVYPQN